MTYNQFKTKWLGKRVDYDKVFGYQCVDLIKQYLYEKYAIRSGAWGDAINYWNNTHPDILKKFDRIATTKTQMGDIVILKPTLTNKYGHIGVADGVSGLLNFPLLEQNGKGTGTGLGADAIRVSSRTRIRIAGVLRPKPTVTPVYYTIKAGDTVSSICVKYGITITKFKLLNPTIKDINVISIGQKVRVK